MYFIHTHVDAFLTKFTSINPAPLVVLRSALLSHVTVATSIFFIQSVETALYQCQVNCIVYSPPAATWTCITILQAIILFILSYDKKVIFLCGVTIRVNILGLVWFKCTQAWWIDKFATAPNNINLISPQKTPISPLTDPQFNKSFGSCFVVLFPFLSHSFTRTNAPSCVCLSFSTSLSSLNGCHESCGTFKC